ncbi:MAG: hypothetical protein K0R67_3643, partial [Paenibacillus sp.]|nr:hypothetical protein [Paenibacillus sp.]
FINANLKVFFVPSVRYGREIVEFIQRTGIEYETVTYDRAWDLNKWGIGNYYDVRAAIHDFRVIHANLEQALMSDAHYDVMVIPGVNGWSHFSAPTRQAILRRVQEGAGLVLIKPFHGSNMEQSEELSQLSPLVNLFEEGFGDDPNAGGGFPKIAYDQMLQEKWTAKSHYITDGIPFELFPYGELAFYPYESVGETILSGESGRPIAAVQSYGKGRVAAFGYFPRDIVPQHSEFTGQESTYDAIIESWSGARGSVSFPYLEYFYELIYRSVIWTANRAPDNCIQSIKAEDEQVIVQATINKEDCSLRYTIRNSVNDIVFEGNKAGLSFGLPHELKLGGTYRVEVSMHQDGHLLDWGTIAVEYPLAAQITAAAFGADELEVGDPLLASIRVSGVPGVCQISVVDDFERILALRTFPFAREQELLFEHQTVANPSMYIRIRAELYVEGTLIQRMDSRRKVVTPSDRTLSDFEVFMCPQNRGHGDLLPLVGDRFREMGVTGLFPGSPKTLTMSGAKGLGIYWYHRGPYVERKEQYFRTKDKAYLHRTPCLNDPALWKELQEDITRAIHKYRKYGPVSYFANDEGSITCYVDELDLCFCPHCMQEMRKWLQSEYLSLDHMNQLWGSCFQFWDQVIPFTLEEAQDSGEYASWGDHRRFMEMTFAEAYRRIFSIVREADPAGVIRMSGCQASTAYSGYDYYKLHQHVGYFEAYGSGNQFEYHRSFARPKTIIGGWFGYGAYGISVQNSIWNALFHNLTLISIFWEYSCLNPDFTFSRSAQDMSKAFLEIRREGIGKLLLHSAVRDSLGIAIHYSMHSIHGAHIRNETIRFEANRQGWIDILEDLGYQYNFVASQQIESGALVEEGYKCLILPFSIALTDEEVEQIRRFAENGGTVLGDLQTGIMDEHCILSHVGKLDDLFGIERLNTRARPFYINKGYRTNQAFTYFSFNLEHIPGREDEESGLVMAEIGTRVKEGQAAYVDDFMGTVASVIVKESGAGKGIYLNMGLDQYPLLRRNGGGVALRELIKHLMQLGGIEKPVLIKDSNSRTTIECGFETIYYSDGAAQYIAVQSKLAGRSLGHDGLSVGGGRTESDRENHLTVEFNRKGHVYNIRERSYVGHTDQASAILPYGESQLFALLPYRVSGVQIEIASQVERGTTLRAVLRIEAEHAEPGRECKHVLSINVYNPAGTYNWIYSTNQQVDAEGKVECAWPIPFNELTGLWKVVAKDVASGIQVTEMVEIV